MEKVPAKLTEDGLEMTLPDRKYESIVVHNSSSYVVKVHVFTETNKKDPTRSRLRVVILDPSDPDPI